MRAPRRNSAHWRNSPVLCLMSLVMLAGLSWSCRKERTVLPGKLQFSESRTPLYGALHFAPAAVRVTDNFPIFALDGYHCDSLPVQALVAEVKCRNGEKGYKYLISRPNSDTVSNACKYSYLGESSAGTVEGQQALDIRQTAFYVASGQVLYTEYDGVQAILTTQQVWEAGVFTDHLRQYRSVWYCSDRTPLYLVLSYRVNSETVQDDEAEFLRAGEQIIKNLSINPDKK